MKTRLSSLFDGVIFDAFLFIFLSSCDFLEIIIYNEIVAGTKRTGRKRHAKTFISLVNEYQKKYNIGTVNAALMAVWTMGWMKMNTIKKVDPGFLQVTVF